MSNKSYIGDAVYVEIEDGTIKLTTEDGLHTPNNLIYLEMDIYENLVSFVARFLENQCPQDKTP